MTDLLGCPFCGGEARVIEGDEAAYVQCTNVKMHRALWFQGDNAAADEVREQWNRRAPAPTGSDGVTLTGGEIWEFLFGDMQGDVPEQLTDAVLDRLALHIRTHFITSAVPVVASEGEPVAYRWTYSIEPGGRLLGPFHGAKAPPDLSLWPNATVAPLFTAPPPQDGLSVVVRDLLDNYRSQVPPWIALGLEGALATPTSTGETDTASTIRKEALQ